MLKWTSNATANYAARSALESAECQQNDKMLVLRPVGSGMKVTPVLLFTFSSTLSWFQVYFR